MPYVPVNLLSDDERLKIRNSLRDVTTGTFFRSDIEYHITGASLDRFQEGTAKEDTPYALVGLLTHKGDDKNFGKELASGMLDEAEIKVTLNYEDLQALSLTDDTHKVSIFRDGRDYFIVEGRKYVVMWVGNSGYLSDQPVLVILYGKNRS